jgi:para-nitrobenzyl esterase
MPISRRQFIANTSLAALALRSSTLLAQSPTSPSLLHTPSGLLRGEQSGDVLIFRGVPFAQPPIGPLRFRPPVPIKPWTGERDATRFSAAAVQSGAPALPQSEDCLYLNIWAPTGKAPAKGPFPVYVWIHGGGFTGGSAIEPMFDGTTLAQQGIISITVPYRLGVLGFLDLDPLLGPDYAGSANNALRDLIAALQWIQQNIAAFNGDPTRVTIGGESAGAKLADILLGVPSAQPLFHQVVSESGGAERVFSKAESATVSEAFGKLWRATPGNELANLRTAPADALIQTQKQFLADYPRHFPLRAQIDGDLLPRLPVETIASGSALGKRLLIGTNRDESAAFLGPHPQHDPGAADLGNLPTTQFDPVFAKYKDIYPLMTAEQLRIRAATAEEYWVPSIRTADAHVKGGGSAFMYRLDFAESSGYFRGYAFHSLDIRLVWNRPSTSIANAADEAALALTMNQAWVAFLRGELPSAKGLPEWSPYNPIDRPTMVFDITSHLDLKPREAELRLWDGLL